VRSNLQRKPGSPTVLACAAPRQAPWRSSGFEHLHGKEAVPVRVRERGLSICGTFVVAGRRVSVLTADRVHAIAATLPGAAWQRCRTHFMRNFLTRVAKVGAELRGRPTDEA